MEHHLLLKGEQLKHVSWKTGQALLPAHLIAQERALLAHTRRYTAMLGLPCYGIESLKWDNAKLQRGIINIEKMHAIFPNGEIINVPSNATVPHYSLPKVRNKTVSLYLYLLKSQSEHEDEIEAEEGSEKILFSMYQLKLSTDSDLSLKSSLKIAELESNAEGFWKLGEYIPPSLSVVETPFFKSYRDQVKSYLEGLKEEFKYDTRTIDTRICLKEVTKVERYLQNVEEKTLFHPYFFYEHLCQLLDTLSLIHADRTPPDITLYDHNKLDCIFSKLINNICNYNTTSTEKMHQIEFEKKEDCFLSEELPSTLKDATEIYLILQPPKNTLIKSDIEGIKLAAYSRLPIICQFALSGIELLRLETAPFNNNFSKSAYIFSVKKGVEWNTAIKERRIAFACHSSSDALHPCLYWKSEAIK
ncbi:MAG: type VI secretion system baseplate subunit TssK [Candidatus Algichlamydia australiensis]|nr:type VI secretion system baseplate subunit TssK [Chlamydiales bacterium]